MKSSTFCIILYFLPVFLLISCQKSHKRSSKYDNIQKLIQQEFDLAKDPVFNIVPSDRLLEAIEVRDAKLNAMQTLSGIQSMLASVSGISWEERGPVNIG